MDIDNLGLMTSGNVPPFPSELLGSDKDIPYEWNKNINNK